MKFDWKLWTIAALVLALVLLILFQPKRQPNLDKIKALETRIASDQEEKEELKTKHEQDSTKSAQEIAQLKKQLADKGIQVVKLSSNLRDLKAKPEVVNIIEAHPIIDTVFRYYDSLLIGKDQELAIQDAIIKSQEVENKRITENFGARLRITEEQFAKQIEITSHYKKEIRKVRRINKVLKIGLFVVPVGLLLLTN